MAKVLVEFDELEGIPKELVIIWGEQVFVQKLDYKGVLLCCSSCGSTGNLRVECPWRKEFEDLRWKRKLKKITLDLSPKIEEAMEAIEDKSLNESHIPYEDLIASELCFIKSVEKKFDSKQGNFLVNLNQSEGSDFVYVDCGSGEDIEEGLETPEGLKVTNVTMEREGLWENKDSIVPVLFENQSSLFVFEGLEDSSFLKVDKVEELRDFMVTPIRTYVNIPI